MILYLEVKKINTPDLTPQNTIVAANFEADQEHKG